MTPAITDKSYICDECHAGIMRPHPEEFKALNNYYKCPLCGFVLHLDKEINPLHKIIGGSDGK